MLLIPLIVSKFQMWPLGITFKHYPLCSILLWEKNMSGFAWNSEYKVTNSCQGGLNLLAFLGDAGNVEQVEQQSKMCRRSATASKKEKCVLHFYHTQEHQHKWNYLNMWNNISNNCTLRKPGLLPGPSIGLVYWLYIYLIYRKFMCSHKGRGGEGRRSSSNEDGTGGHCR